MRKRKWWWSIFWALGVLLVNTYVAYKTYMVFIGKQPMSHYNFCKAIALAWIDPATYWSDRMKKMHMSQEQWMTETQTTSASTTVKEMMSVHHLMTGPCGAVCDGSQVQGQCKQME